MLHDDSFVTGLLIGDKEGYARGYQEGDEAGYDRGFEEGGGGASARDTIEFGAGMTVDIWKVPSYTDRPVHGSLDDSDIDNQCQWTLWRTNYCCGVLSAIYDVIAMPKLKYQPGTLTKIRSTIWLDMLAKQDGANDVFAETSFAINSADGYALRAWDAPMWLIVGPTIILCVTKPHAYSIPWILWGFVFGQTKDSGAWRVFNGVGYTSDAGDWKNGTAGDLKDTTISPTVTVSENKVTVSIGGQPADVENLWCIKNTGGIVKDEGGQRVYPNFASVGTSTKHSSGRRLLYLAHNITSVTNYGNIQNTYCILLPNGTSKANWRGLLDEDIVNENLLPWDRVPDVEEDNTVPAYGDSEKQDSTPNSYYSGYNKGYEAGLAAGGGGSGDPDGSYDEGYQEGYQDGYKAGVAASGSSDGYTLHPALDGATELHIAIEAVSLRDQQLCFCQTVSAGVRIDWGDGSAVEVFSGTGPMYPTHTYSGNGEYVIRLLPADGCVLTLGGGTAVAKTIFNDSTSVAAGRGVVLKKALVGKCITTIGRFAFENCWNLNEAYICDGVTELGQNCFFNCNSLHRIRLPSTLTTMSAGSEFSGCQGLSAIDIPAAVTAIGANSFNACHGLKRVSFPGITSIAASALVGCRGVQRVDFPATLKTLAYNFASSAINLREIHIAAATPPTLNGTLATGYGNFVVYIPAGSLAAYSAANYWKNIIAKLIEE